jgi:HEAT repeat protein
MVIPSNVPPRGRRRERKEAVIRFLVDRNYDGLFALLEEDRSAMQVVHALLVEKDDLLRWRALEFTGREAARAVAEAGLEAGRERIRRLIWLMNEESGNVIPQAPVAIATILGEVPDLVPEFGRILASYFDEPSFRRGVAWGVARVAVISAKPYGEIVTDLLDALLDGDPYVRAFTTIALGALGRPGAAIDSGTGARDESWIALYDFEKGLIKRATVGRIAQAVQEGRDLAGLLLGSLTE